MAEQSIHPPISTIYRSKSPKKRATRSVSRPSNASLATSKGRARLALRPSPRSPDMRATAGGASFAPHTHTSNATGRCATNRCDTIATSRTDSDKKDSDRKADANRCAPSHRQNKAQTSPLGNSYNHYRLGDPGSNGVPKGSDRNNKQDRYNKQGRYPRAISSANTNNR